MSRSIAVRERLREKRIRLHLAIAVSAMALTGTTVFGGWHAYQRMTTYIITAYFAKVVALYPGDNVLIAGVQVGSITSIQPAGDTTKVTMRVSSKYPVPANVTASVLNPSLVASRVVQLSPTYVEGPTLQPGAVIPAERTQVPVEWDDLRDQVAHLTKSLGPTPDQPKGPFGDAVEALADGLAGKGQQINTALTNLSDALTTVGQGRTDLFAVLKSLAQFVNALQHDDARFVALNNDLAQLTGLLTNTDQELATAVDRINALLGTVKKFLDDNKSLLITDINQLAQSTTAIMQPAPREGLENALHVTPNLGANLLNIYEPNHGSLTALPVLANFANPVQFLCSTIQAASRLGYQDSAELCAQYLAPVLDALKFNYLPGGLNMFTTASTLPKQVAYSEPRLIPQPGFKDTTVPGIFARDTLLSHGNREPGWTVAPGMQGTQVQPATADMLTPDSLAELLGGADIVAPPPGQRMPGPPNAYDQTNPPPPDGSPLPAEAIAPQAEP